MTLKEKFEEKAFCICEDITQIDNYVDVAEDFAIGFAEWCKQEYELEDTSFHNKWRDVNGEYRESKELLEIYKKEKGL
jgi:hypothetical protein